MVVAAEPFELKHIRTGRGLEFVTVAGGAGPRLAAAAIEKVAGPFDAVLSTGLCGALNPSLNIGEVFVAAAVNGEAIQLPSTSEKYRSGALLSVDRIVGTVEERRRLFGAGYDAVEMEAAAAMEQARRWKVPFYAVRAVSDTADEEFALDLNLARDRAGRIRVTKILMQAVRKPGRAIPELIRLGRNAAVAVRALGAFIATCDL